MRTQKEFLMWANVRSSMSNDYDRKYNTSQNNPNVVFQSRE